MSRILRRAAVMALAAASASGLATATPAEAASAGYTQLEICHTGATNLNMYIVGYNQVGDWVKSYTAKIPPYSCYWMSNWWWQTGQAFELHWEVANSVSNWHWNPVFIPSSASDGGWQQATIYQ